MPEQAGTALERILRAGGPPGIALLQYCVQSVTMEPLFAFLAWEYRLRPSHLSALALYDIFCAPEAPARVNAVSILPPRDLRLAMAIQSIRRQWQQMQLPEPPAPGTGIPITAPMHGVFDSVVELLRTDPSGRIAHLANCYDPNRSPSQNLPDGKMTSGQRNFAENVWKPVVRPRLVAAGFWRVQTIE